MSSHLVREALAPLIYGAAAYTAANKPSQAVMPLVGGLSLEGLKAALPAAMSAKKDVPEALAAAARLSAPALLGSAFAEDDPEGAIGQALGALGGGAAGLALGTKYLVPKEAIPQRAHRAALAAAIGAAIGAKLTGRPKERRPPPMRHPRDSHADGADEARYVLGLQKLSMARGAGRFSGRPKAPRTVAPTAPGVTAPGTTTAPGTSTAPGTTAPGTTAPGTTAPGTTAPGTQTRNQRKTRATTSTNAAAAAHEAAVASSAAETAVPPTTPEAPAGGGFWSNMATFGLPIGMLGYQIYSGERDRNDRTRQQLSNPYVPMGQPYGY